MLTVAKAFQQHRATFNGTILFVATVGEEGQGDLRGVRHLFGKELKGQVDAFISVDGTGLGLTARGVVRRVYTDLAVLDIDADGFVVPGVR